MVLLMPMVLLELLMLLGLMIILLGQCCWMCSVGSIEVLLGLLVPDGSSSAGIACASGPVGSDGSYWICAGRACWCEYLHFLKPHPSISRGVACETNLA